MVLPIADLLHPNTRDLGSEENMTNSVKMKHILNGCHPEVSPDLMIIRVMIIEMMDFKVGSQGTRSEWLIAIIGGRMSHYFSKPPLIN